MRYPIYSLILLSSIGFSENNKRHQQINLQLGWNQYDLTQLNKVYILPSLFWDHTLRSGFNITAKYQYPVFGKFSVNVGVSYHIARLYKKDKFIKLGETPDDYLGSYTGYLTLITSLLAPQIGINYSIPYDKYVITLEYQYLVGFGKVSYRSWKKGNSDKSGFNRYGNGNGHEITIGGDFNFKDNWGFTGCVGHRFLVTEDLTDKDGDKWIVQWRGNDALNLDFSGYFMALGLQYEF